MFIQCKMKGPTDKLIFGVLALLVLIYCIVQGLKGGDFKIYMGAAELLKEGQSCYNQWIFLGGQNYGRYLYSPFFAFLLMPFTILPKGITAILWLILNLFFLRRIFQISIKWLDVNYFSKKQFKLWIGLSLLLSMRFILHNFEMVQMNIFLLYVCLESIALLEHHQHFKSAILLSFGISIKVLPIVLIPYLIFRRKFKASLYSLFLIIAFTLLPSLYLGWEKNEQFLKEWYEIIDPSNDVYISDQNKYGEGVHSLSGLYAAYFSPSESMLDTDSSRLIVELSPHQLSFLLNSSRLFLIIAFLFFLRTWPFRAVSNKRKQYRELSYLLCIVPLIFPHQQKYAFVFMLPSICYMTNFILLHWNDDNFGHFKRSIYILILSIFFILTTLTTDGIVGNKLNDLSEYYKTITFGCILLLLLLFSSGTDRYKTS